MEGVRDFEGLTVIMGHAPDFALDLITNGSQVAMLCLAGHTHGGQVVIPGLGPPLILSRIPRKYAAGLHALGKAWLLVSRGAGHERGSAPRIRLNCRPELAVITLHSKATRSRVRR